MKNFLLSLLRFVAVAFALVVIGGGIWFMATLNSFKEVQPETWTCIDAFGYGHDVRWESKSQGTDVNVLSDTAVHFFALSCLPNPKGNCFENEGWYGAKIDVSGGPTPQSFSFTRDSTNVDASMRHHVTVHWDLARGLIASFRAGKEAEIATLGRKGDVLKTTKVKLDGFGPEMDKCLTIWAEKKASRKQ